MNMMIWDRKIHPLLNSFYTFVRQLPHIYVCTHKGLNLKYSVLLLPRMHVQGVK